MKGTNVLRHLKKSNLQIAKVLGTLVITSLLQIVFPFLTRSIVDTGIHTKNLKFIVLVLIGQSMLIFGRVTMEFIRNRLLLSLSLVINISILTDFLIKLSKLPISYFSTHPTGEILQRIEDNKKIESFITGPALNTLFSILNFVVFGIVLMHFNIKLFLIFLIGSSLYFAWVQAFLKMRRRINHEIFSVNSKEYSSTLQYIQGIIDIRLNNSGEQKRAKWKKIKELKFKLEFKNLQYSQIQWAGATLINQAKDVTMTFIVANYVIEGNLTLGDLMAVQYIIGQLSGPIEQLIGFVQNAQDAKISMERIQDVHKLDDEESPNAALLKHLPENESINLKNISFAYPGEHKVPVLKNINLNIPSGKVTALVGESGSGKTTIIKLLLRFHELYNGEIMVGNSNLRDYSQTYWRSQCGSVLQNGFIFEDTILENITLGSSKIDYSRIVECCRIANILTYIMSLPDQFSTEIGSNGIGLSQGQSQRLLIARSIYKSPKYLFFDEATNALDAINEKSIMENLHYFFKQRTVLIVAHRLSTIVNADNIVVFSNGEIKEQGTHQQLLKNKGKYFELVKNQLNQSGHIID